MTALKRREQSGQAQRHVGAVVEGQQQQFQMCQALGGGCGDAGNDSQQVFRHGRDDVLDVAPAIGFEQLREALTLEVAAEQGGEPRAGHTKRKTVGLIAGQHEDVAQQFSYRVGLNSAAVRCTGISPLFVPIREEFLS